MTSRAIASTARPDGKPFLPRDGAFERLHRGRLGVEHELVQPLVTLRCVADEQGPRHVAAIAGDLSAEVEEEDRTLEDRAIAGCSVRQSRLRARQTCDLEGQRLGAVGPHQPLEAKRERRPRSCLAGSPGAARRAPCRRPHTPLRPARAPRAPSSPGRPRSSPRSVPARHRVRRPQASSRSPVARRPPRPRRASRPSTRRAPASASAGRRTRSRSMPRALPARPGSRSASQRTG